MGSTKASSGKKPFGLVKALFFGALALVFTTALVIVFFGPAIAGTFVPGAIEKAVNPTIAGSVRVSDVKLTWSGPQRVGRIEVLAENGDALGTYETALQAQLIALARGDLNLGEVTLTRVETDALDGECLGRLSAALASTAPPSGEPMRVPESLVGTFKLDLGDVQLESAGMSTTLTGVRAEAVVQPGAATTLEVFANDAAGSEALRVDVSAPTLIAADGLVTLRGSGLTIDALAHAQDTDAVRALWALITGQSTDPTGGSARLALRLEERDGTLVPPNGEPGLRLTGAIPADALRTLAGVDVVASIDATPSFSLATSAIALPLPDATTGAFDARLIRFAGRLDVDGVRATLTDGRAVALDPVRANLTYDQELGSLVADGRTGASIDGTSAGTINLLATAMGFIDDNGTLRTGGPTRVEGSVRALDVPTVLAQMFLPTTIDATEALGERVDLRAEVMLDTEAPAITGTDLQPGEPSIRLTLAGGGQELRANLVFDGARSLRTAGPRGIVLNSERLGALARAVLGPDAALTVDERGTGELVVRDAVFSIGSAGFDVDASRATIGLDANGLVARQGDGEPFTLDTMTMNATLERGSLAWDGDAELATLGERARLNSAGRVDALVSGAPAVSGSIDAENLPGARASRGGAAGGAAFDGSIGPSLTGRIATTDAATGAFQLDLSGAHGTLTGPFVITGGALRSGTTPVTISTTRPGPTINAFAGGLPITLDPAGDASLTLSNLAIDLDADRRFAPLRGVRGTVELRASGIGGTLDDSTGIGFTTMDATASLDSTGVFSGTLDIAGDAGGAPLRAKGPFEITPLLDNAGMIDLLMPKLTADIEGTLPPALARLVDDADVRDAVTELSGGRAMPFSLKTSAAAARTLGGVELVVASADERTRLVVPVGATQRGWIVGDASLDFIYTQSLHEILERRLLTGTDYAGIRVTRNGASARAEVPVFVLPLRNRQTPDIGNVEQLRARVLFRDLERPLVLENVPSPDGGPRVGPVGLRMLSAEYLENAQFRNERDAVSLQGVLYKPGAEERYDNAGAVFRVNLSRPFELLLGQVELQSDPRHLDDVLGLNGLGEQLFGNRLRANFSGAVIGDDDDRFPQITFDVVSQRMFARGGAWRLPSGGFRFDRTPTGVYLFADQATELLLGGLSESGGVRFAEDFEFRSLFTTLALGPFDALLSETDFALEGTISSTPITLSHSDGELEELGELEGTVRLDGPNRIAFDIFGERAVEGPVLPGRTDRERTLTMRGVVTGFADSAGQPALGGASIEELELEGSIPTALVDQLGSMNGLLVAALGQRTTVNASITPADDPRLPDEFVASFSSMNARGGVQGTITPERVLVVPAGAEFSVSQITNQLSERVLGGVFPMFRSFEKSAMDEPLRITTTGLRIPLDADVSKLDGDLRVDVGTLRFETATLFGRLLSLTENNIDGEIGRKLEPFDVTIDEGVIRYADVKVPLGEIELSMTGRVNLKSKRVNTLVSVPYYALNDELASVVSRVPGVRRLTMIPIRVRGPLGSPTYEIDPEALIENLPNALGGTLEDLLGIPGGLLDGPRNDDR